MLTAIGRAATQRLFLRAAPLAGLRTQPVVRAARRGFSTSQWARMPAAKASSTTTKTKKSTAAKDGAATEKKKKKATAKAKTTEGAATKPKEKKKPVTKKRVEVLTPEEKQKLDMRNWKKLALLPDPKRLPVTTWTVYIGEKVKSVGSVAEARNVMKENSESFKNLSSYELQRLQEKADENKLVNNATYKAWVESHTPQAVAEANRARMHLRNARGTRVTRSPAHIQDERQPTRAAAAFALFMKARWASGDYADLSVAEASRRGGEEWKNLSESEKGVYNDLSRADRDRYARDALNVLGHVVVPSRKTTV
ncbi:hypothetical protein LX32DRAFT_637786 [Colletotrichum zoysiae]|uniref:HMG box domain-containing protein n=1 Tax=Colletotrichum zoysiae TaxID=1216348 RepID=A0AAD9HKQ9_9PEZI|nr:hypothetical protein LX32DRAFT_637786 [Colletotrichum zoysiae]